MRSIKGHHRAADSNEDPKKRRTRSDRSQHTQCVRLRQSIPGAKQITAGGKTSEIMQSGVWVNRALSTDDTE